MKKTLGGQYRSGKTSHCDLHGGQVSNQASEGSRALTGVREGADEREGTKAILELLAATGQGSNAA